jgi:hypothetical protein
LTGFQKSILFKTCWLLIKHHFGCSNEEKDFWIIDWFLTVDLGYLIPPIYRFLDLLYFQIELGPQVGPELPETNSHWSPFFFFLWCLVHVACYIIVKSE